MTGSYNNFFRVFDRHTKRDVTLEASKEIAKPKTVLKPRKVSCKGFYIICVAFTKAIRIFLRHFRHEISIYINILIVIMINLQ